MEYFIQGGGLLGAVFAFIAFQCKKHFSIMIVKTCSALCFVLQFALMKAYTGLAMNIFGVIVLVTDAILVAKNVKTLPFVIASSILCVAIGAFSWVSAASLLAITGELIVTVAFGIKDPDRVRYVYFFGSLCWLVYDSIYFTLGGIVTEVFSLVSIIIATVSLIVKNRKKTREEIKSRQ